MVKKCIKIGLKEGGYVQKFVKTIRASFLFNEGPLPPVFAGSVLCCGEAGVWRLVTALVNPSVLASAAVSGRRKYLHFKRISQKLVVEVCPENCASLMSALTRLVTPAQLHWRHSSPGALLLSHL